MLYPPTCVGFGTGGMARSLGVFLGSMGSPASRLCASSRVSGCAPADFPAGAPYLLSRGRPEPRPATLLRHPDRDSARQPVRECRPVMHRLRLSASP